MTVGGFIPLEVEEFAGLYTNVVTALDAPVYQGSARGKIRTSALEAKNLRFIPGGFLGRDGLTTAFDFGGTRKATHIAQLITQQDQRQILVVADDGGLYGEPTSGQALVALKTDWAPATAIGHSATLFDREHLAVSDGRVGSGSPVVWDRTNLDRMSPSGPGKSHTLAAGAAGLVTNGDHKVVVIFETRHGFRPAPSESVEITVAGNTKIAASNIPLGPSWVVRRILAMTTAAGASFFFVSDSSAGMIIDDNTTTTTTIDVADATLSAGTLVDKLFRRVVLPEVAGVLAYGDRLAAWGARERIALDNLDFDGGFDPANPAVPAGWTGGSGTPPSSEGPNNPAGASGTGWSNPTNVFTSNNAYAVATVPAGGTTNDLDVTNFGFSVPGTATIDGITVKIERHKDPADPESSSLKDQTVQLLKAGAPIGNNKASGVWPTFDQVRSYGASSDLWGTTWTPAEVNATNFGIRLAVKEVLGIVPVDALVDHITITANYTLAGGGGAGGGSQEKDDVYFGHAYKIAGNGVDDIRGDIKLAIDTDTSTLFFPPGTKLKFRVRAKRTPGLAAGALRIALDNTSTPLLITAAQLTTQWEPYESSEITIESPPTQLEVRGDSDGTNPLTNGESVFVDDIQIFPAETPFQSSRVYISDPSDPEAYDGVKGFIQVSPDDGQKVVTTFKFRDLLFIVKERSLYVTRNDGVNPPSLWPVNFVDNIGCDSLHGVAVAGEQFAIISYRAGVYAIFGLRPVKINQEIQQSPAGFVSWDDREEPQAYKNHVMIDPEKKNIYLSVVRSGGTWPNRTFVLNYWKGWGEQERKWSHDDWNLPSFTPANVVTASALIEESSKQSLFFGSEELNLFRNAGTSDDSNVIEHSYRGAYAGFQGSYGDNLFGALSIHGLTSGSNLIIEALEIDETLNTFSQVGGETLTAAKYLELQTNLTALKLSYRLRSNTLDSTIRVDSMTIWGRAWQQVGIM
ncbi:hypothetical protein LCGC14_0903390 [marine sediment metagenome]|uniref:Uncharacterized protein n=1 Tax=marine sediment metagenome TaxID=412755 RepID=A0A0F9NVQ1_9ZZZZ